MRTIRVRGVEYMVAEIRPYWLHYWDEVERGEWEADTFETLDRYLTPDSSFVDIGAWVGPLTLYAAKKCRWVYAIEPDPDARQRLGTNLLLNKIKNVTPDWRALSNTAGPATLGNRHEFGDSESSLNWPGGVVVQTVRLEDWWNEVGITDASLIKIDIEGGEGYVLPDAAEFLKSLRIPIHLSLHGLWVRPEQRAGMQAALAVWDVVYDPNFRGSIIL